MLLPSHSKALFLSPRLPYLPYSNSRLQFGKKESDEMIYYSSSSYASVVVVIVAARNKKPDAQKVNFLLLIYKLAQLEFVLFFVENY